MKRILFFILAGIFQQALCQTIWVLENSDPDYKNPPFQDSLKVFNSQGSLQSAFSGFNFSETVGGHRAINAHTEDASCWTTENVSHLLKRVSTNGTTLVNLALPISALDIGPQGLLYALRDKGTIYGDSVYIITAQGNIVARAAFGGLDISVDSQHSSVWIVGSSIRRLNLQLESQMSIDPISWTAVSVDYDSDGTAWVAERWYGGSTGGQNRLLHIAQNGTILNTVALPTSPFCVRVDRLRRTVWIIGGRLYKYDLATSSLATIDGNKGWSIDIQPENGIVWVGGYSALRSFSSSGQLRSVHAFSSSAQKYVSVSVMAPKWEYEYAAKIICGISMNPHDLRLVRGAYATTINIHNPNDSTISFFKKLVLTYPPESQQPGKIIPIGVDKLVADQALKVDGMDIRMKLFPNGFPTPYIEGFVVIQSQASLDVTAVYTAATYEGSLSSIDVEQIPERAIKIINR